VASEAAPQLLSLLLPASAGAPCSNRHRSTAKPQVT
jgi:hypothetical protein